MTVTPDFDPADLERFLGGVVQIAPVSSGQSNPTWFVTHNGTAMVLRKKPKGATVAGAHAIEREFRILKALQNTAVPVPQVTQLIEDPAVIGTPFYLMHRLPGHVSEDSFLPDLDPQARQNLHLDAARVLGNLHHLDWAALGLADYGRHDGFYGRQVKRWCRQWHELTARNDPRLDAMADWFAANIPPEAPTTIVHGDYRIGNLIHGSDPGHVSGVLDWELSTLGDPLADLAHWAMFYDLRPDQMGGLAGLDLARLGIPDRNAFLDAYRAAGGTTAELTPFHRAFAHFRMCIILEGITARADAGQSASADARAVGALAPDFARLAEQLISTDHPAL